MRSERRLDLAIVAVLVAVLVSVGVVAILVYDASRSGGDRAAGSPRAEAADLPSQTAPPVDPAPTASPDASNDSRAAPGPAASFRAAPDWLATTAAATGIPVRALQAYASAHLRIADEQPDCGVAWNTIAAIGEIESGHGSASDAVLSHDGRSTPPIIGPALDGEQFAAIGDTGGGELDGDRTWDRAIGPMQFLPSTWERWGADADGDGLADPFQIDDAALAAGRYLCATGDLSADGAWSDAVFSYNHSAAYVQRVADTANRYAAAAG